MADGYPAILLMSHNRLTALATRLVINVGCADQVGADLQKLRGFIHEASLHYRNNPYHNWRHAVDVARTLSCVLVRTPLGRQIDPIDRFWLLIAALVHDIDHPGNNNQWEIATLSRLTFLYGTRAVLEHHSLNVAAALMGQPRYRFAEGMPPHVRARGAALLRDLILATDFGSHLLFMARLRRAIDQSPGPEQLVQPEFKLLMLQALLKGADIANAAKPPPEAGVWARLMMQEFWMQGAMEKAAGFPVGAMNDPDRVTLKAAQSRFIESAALTLFVQLARVEPQMRQFALALNDRLRRYRKDEADSAAPAAGLQPAPGLEETVQVEFRAS